MFSSFGLPRFCRPTRFLFLLIHIVLLDEREHHHWKNSSLRLKAVTSKQAAKASRSIRLASSTFEDDKHFNRAELQKRRTIYWAALTCAASIGCACSPYARLGEGPSC